jgi:hypothetical protein
MVKIFVAQTLEKDRHMVCDFLNVSGHEAQPYKTDMSSLTRLTWDVMSMTKPAVIITSQRGSGNPYVSNILHTVAFNLPIRTLTIAYTRAAAQHDYMEEVRGYIAQLMSSQMHQLKIVPKHDDVRRNDELQVIKGYVEAFAQQCPM